MEARGKRAAFSKVRWARSVRPRRRQLPQGPSVCDKIGASSDCSRPVNDYVHIEAADLRRPNARFTTERQGYQVLTPFGKLGYSQFSNRATTPLWRRLILPPGIKRWSLTSLQQRLVKTGGRLVKHARYYWLLLAEGHLNRRLFGEMLRRIWALPVPDG